MGSATLQTRGKMMAMTVDNILSGQHIILRMIMRKIIARRKMSKVGKLQKFLLIFVFP